MSDAFPTYSFLEEAAAEARLASRQLWLKGGQMDQKLPCLPSKGWYIPLVDDRQKKLDASIKRNRGEP